MGNKAGPEAEIQNLDMKLPTKKHSCINLAIKSLLAYEFRTFLITSPRNSCHPSTAPGSAVKVTESNKSSSLAMRAMPSGTPTPKFTTHFGVNSLGVSFLYRKRRVHIPHLGKFGKSSTQKYREGWGYVGENQESIYFINAFLFWRLIRIDLGAGPPQP